MSVRSAKKPVEIPSGVEANLSANLLKIKGPKGTLELEINPHVVLKIDENNFIFGEPKNDFKALTGTACAHIKNMLQGVTVGFKKHLVMVGVGYKAQLQGKKLVLNLGYSHPIEFTAPEGVTIECPSQTEIIVEGADKQKVGQAAAEIRDFRAPEPYKGKGVKYINEIIIRKETKKK